MELKVCGLTKTEELQFCVDNDVNYCGFILNYPKSHRFITLEKVRTLTNIEKKNSSYVGVLVKPTNKELEIFSKFNFDYLQLYGNYSKQELVEIKENFGRKIITAIQVEDEKDIEKFKIFEDVSEIILWDSSGYEKSLSWNFDWVRSIKTNAKKMIAGNIRLDKLDDLAKITDIIDVSGALETNKVKDINKIKNFITKIKKINNEN
tara:strand:- start:211 stop:828 length:618 start_codon:yes stop_codon:yes gene_type:complete